MARVGPPKRRTWPRRRSAAKDASVESFLGPLWDKCLNEALFRSLGHARAVLSAWREDHNHVRPHGAPRGLTPAKAAEFARGTDDEHSTNPGL
jgi:putative transposase